MEQGKGEDKEETPIITRVNNNTTGFGGQKLTKVTRTASKQQGQA